MEEGYGRDTRGYERDTKYERNVSNIEGGI